jgi:hypothetical protein
MSNPLVTGPLLSTLLRLAAPNVLAMTMSVAVGVAETWYIGLLGTGPLAAMALVFPFAMLTQTMSSGADGRRSVVRRQPRAGRATRRAREPWPFTRP